MDNENYEKIYTELKLLYKQKDELKYRENELLCQLSQKEFENRNLCDKNEILRKESSELKNQIKLLKKKITQVQKKNDNEIRKKENLINQVRTDNWDNRKKIFLSENLYHKKSNAFLIKLINLISRKINISPEIIFSIQLIADDINDSIIEKILNIVLDNNNTKIEMNEEKYNEIAEKLTDILNNIKS